jgi:hypothetical protein
MQTLYMIPAEPIISAEIPTEGRTQYGVTQMILSHHGKNVCLLVLLNCKIVTKMKDSKEIDLLNIEAVKENQSMGIHVYLGIQKSCLLIIMSMETFMEPLGAIITAEIQMV